MQDTECLLPWLIQKLPRVSAIYRLSQISSLHHLLMAHSDSGTPLPEFQEELAIWEAKTYVILLSWNQISNKQFYAIN